jgi:hypothetical protein
VAMAPSVHRQTYHDTGSRGVNRCAADGLRGCHDRVSLRGLCSLHRSPAFCCTSRLFFPRRHRMNCIIERARIADVKDAGCFATPQGVRHVPRQPNVGLPAERRRGAIGRDVGKIPLDPDIELITRMTVVGKRIVRGEAHEQFAPAGGELTMQRRDLDPGRDALPLERFPDDFLQIDEGLPRPKRQRLLVRCRFVSRHALGVGTQQQEKGEANRCESP